MSRKTLLLSCIVLFGLVIFALVVIFMLHTPLEPPDKTPPTIIWSQKYGGKGEEQARSLIQTSDGGYAIAGRTTSFGSDYSCFWLVKVDSSGNMEWNKTYGGPHGGVAWCVQQTSDGGYAIAGETYSFGFQDDVPDYDFWLVKTESMYDETDENGGIQQFLSWIIVTVAIIGIGGVTLLVYFAKIRKTTGKAEIISEGVM